VVASVSTFALVVSIGLLAFTAPSSAEFISYGLATQNDGLLTLDSRTGLEWLDLTSTGNQSFASVIGGYGGFTTTYGLRVASLSEVSTLIADAGGVNGFGSPASIDAASKLLLYFGVLQQLSVGSVTQYFSHGMSTQPVTASPYVSVINLIFEFQTPMQGQTDSINQGSTCPTCTAPYIGTFLVREAASPFAPDSVQPPNVFPPPVGVPEPPSVVLLTLGFACLALVLLCSSVKHA
jgi:hypothetical protein